MTIRFRHRVVRERAITGGREIVLHFDLDDATSVPGTLLLPPNAEPVGSALLIHGYTSRKEHMSEGVGRPLLARGLATLSIDLPLHGTRRESVQAQSVGSPLGVLKQWRLALAESRLAVEYLRARSEVDPSRIGLVGYSLGSFLAVQLAASDPDVRALVVASGGDLPAQTPFGAVARAVADPIRAVRRLRGRPLLLVHGRRDRTVLPEQAERLFAAAADPKEIRWWDAGHHLPKAAIEEAADWLATALGTGTRIA